MNYEILDVDALGRIGKLMVNNKEMITPNLFPVVHPKKNLINSSDLKKIGAQCLFTNAYIIYQNESLKEKVLKSKLHSHLNFDGLIATDSGAFQQYMYQRDQMKIDAEEIELFQENIGSDFPVILDIPVQPDDDFETAKKKVTITIQRAKENIKRRTRENCEWFGPIHGSKHFELLKTSALEMSKLDFGVYAIGGLVKTFLDYRFDLAIKILLNVKKNIIPNKPIHMFGLGLPQFFSLAVACGCDLMDSAAYILFAKEDRYFTLSTGTKNINDLDEFPCHCPICSDYNPREIIKFDEDFRTELIAKHNLYLSFSELRTIRQAIREGNLWELVEQRIRSHPNLVKAFKVIREENKFIELYEKVYKKHGRLYVSSESLDRPLIQRYTEKLQTQYRRPKEARFLILIPELDTKSQYSPTIRDWLEIINNNSIILREHLHIIFISTYFGILPLELIDSFPMGQHEAITSSSKDDATVQESLIKIEAFLNQNLKSYLKCGILIPKTITNYFNEIVDFSKNNLIYEVNSLIKSKFDIKTTTSDDLNYILKSFTEDTK